MNNKFQSFEINIWTESHLVNCILYVNCLKGEWLVGLFEGSKGQIKMNKRGPYKKKKL